MIQSSINRENRYFIFTTRSDEIMRSIYLILCFFFYLPALVSAELNIHEVHISNKTIRIPSPSGYFNVSRCGDQVKSYFLNKNPRQIFKTLAIFIPQDECYKSILKKPHAMPRSIEVISIKETENDEFDEHYFQTVVIKDIEKNNKDISQEVNNLAESYFEKFTKDFFTIDKFRIKAKIGEQKPLGIFAEGPNYIATAQIQKTFFFVNGKRVEHLVAGCVYFLLINKKIILVNFNAEYKSSDDLEWVTSKSAQWIKLFLSSNPF